MQFSLTCVGLNFLFILLFCSVDDGFPVVKFQFENALTLTAYPHDYLFRTKVSVNLFSHCICS